MTRINFKQSKISFLYTVYCSRNLTFWEWEIPETVFKNINYSKINFTLCSMYFLMAYYRKQIKCSYVPFMEQSW